MEEQNKLDAAIEKNMKELPRLQKLKETDPDVYLPQLANTLKNLAILQSKSMRFNEAEDNHAEALEIRRKLAEDGSDDYLYDLASLSLYNLAVLQSKTGRYKEAESNYTEALGIFQKLAEINPDEYLTDAAYTLTLECLIEIKEKLSKTDEAEELKKKLVEIKKEASLLKNKENPRVS